MIIFSINFFVILAWFLKSLIYFITWKLTLFPAYNFVKCEIISLFNYTYFSIKKSSNASSVRFLLEQFEAQSHRAHYTYILGYLCIYFLVDQCRANSYIIQDKIWLLAKFQLSCKTFEISNLKFQPSIAIWIENWILEIKICLCLNFISLGGKISNKVVFQFFF